MDLSNQLRPTTVTEMYPTCPEIATLPVILANTRSGIKPDLSHRILLSGDSHGVGKTSLARCLACDVNEGITDSDRRSVLDGQDCEIATFRNAGTYRKLENARELEDMISTYRRPLYTGIKHFIIIDEIHRMVPAAISALLQPFEDIPDNLYIVATTTDIEALQRNEETGRRNEDGEAFLSRFTIFSFTTMNKQQSVSMIMDLAGKLNLTSVTQNIAEQVFELVGGVPRDIIKTVEHFVTHGVLESKVSKTQTEVTSKDIIHVLIESAVNKDISWYRDIVPRLSNLMSDINGGEARTELIKALAPYIYGSRAIEEHPSIKTAKDQEAYRKSFMNMIKATGILHRALYPITPYPQKTLLTGQIMAAFMEINLL